MPSKRNQWLCFGSCMATDGQKAGKVNSACAHVPIYFNTFQHYVIIAAEYWKTLKKWKYWHKISQW